MSKTAKCAIVAIFVSLLMQLCLPMGIYAQSQDIQASGVVTDATTGEPVIGASVLIDATHGVITDVDGKFTIKVKAGTPLEFSSIGYVAVKVPAQAYMQVKLQVDNVALDESVIIGYGTAKKRDLTGAISTIKTETMETEAPRTVQDLMRSAAAGLNVSMSTNTAGTADLQVRGKNTLSAGSSPLLVLDGVIYEGSLQDINPMDVERIDVLKDASSVAVYGAKAANGVVAITTKKGQKGKPTVSFNANLTLAEHSRMPGVVDGQGFITFRREYFESLRTDAEREQQPQMYDDPRSLSGVDQLAWYNYDQKTPVSTLPGETDLVKTWLSRLSFQTVEIENYLAGVETNWDDEIFQTAVQQDYTASVSNSNDAASYYVSFNMTDREGTTKGDGYQNFRARFNLETYVAEFLTIGVNGQFAHRKGGYLMADRDEREHNSPYTTNEIDNPDSPYRRYPSGDNNTLNPFFDNLYIDRKETNNDFNANIYAKIKLPFGIEYQFNYTPRLHYYEYFNHNSSKHPGWAGNGGETERTHQKTYNWQIDNILRWDKEFGDHHIQATLLQNAEKGQYWSTTAKNKQYSPSDVLSYHRLQSGADPSVESNDTYRTGDALMARLFYSYKNRYMVTASVRRDGYSAFGQANPRATFPAIALGWTFSEEKFLDSTDAWLDFGKLRLSWGENGNRDIGQYAALAQLNTGMYTYLDASGNPYITSQIYINTMPNESLRWERTQAYNAGLDFSIFGGKLSGSVEGYLNKTTDLLVDRSLPSILGYSSVKANLGSLQNKGFELTLESQVFDNENFKWNTSGTFTLNRRKILSLYGDMEDVYDEEGNVIGQKEADDYSNKWFIGHDPNQIWDYERDGVWQLDEAEEAAKYGLRPGDFKYIDQNQDGVLNTDDKVFQGYTTPRYRVSWRNEFNLFKHFNVSFMFYGNFGQYGTLNRAANTGGMYDRYTIVDIPRWTVENPTDDFARIGSTNKGSNYVRKDFVRMDNFTVSYNVPKAFLSKMNIRSMRLSVALRNPMLLTSWYFGDPEGGDYTTHSINFGVNLTL